MVKQNFPIPSKNIELNENKPKVYFADSCDICKKDNVFLLDNLCSDCIENNCTRGKVEGITITRLPNCLCWKSKPWNENLEQKANTESKTKSCPICFNRHRRYLYCTPCEFKINTGVIPDPEKSLESRKVSTLENLFR